MNSAESLLVVGAAALVAGGAYLYIKGKPKANDTVKGVPPIVPKERGVTNQLGDRTSLCQVLTAYESKLHNYQTLKASYEKRMQNLEPFIKSACQSYALDPVYKYHCNGWVDCGLNVWYTIHGTQINQNAFNACMAYAKTGAPLDYRAARRHNNWAYNATWGPLNTINIEINQGYTQVQNLRKQYENAQSLYEQAKSEIMHIQRRIADLQARGVFC
jgi:hypothetical protein